MQNSSQTSHNNELMVTQTRAMLNAMKPSATLDADTVKTFGLLPDRGQILLISNMVIHRVLPDFPIFYEPMSEDM